MNSQCTKEENSLLTNYEWTWDEKLSTSPIILSENNSNVKFHPVGSIGTAVVRGNTPLEKGRHYFWEILMITWIYGTDVMIGVGTEKVQINAGKSVYCSLLGQDRESWGFSYKGYLQHNCKKRKYGTAFNQGNLVGVYLDTWKGTLQFFLDRKPLGIAFTRLNNVTLYPLVSSTMAGCVMKLTCSYSIPVSLQTTCLAALSPLQRTYLSKMYSGLHYLHQNIFTDILQKQTDYDDEDDIEFPTDILDD